MHKILVEVKNKTLSFSLYGIRGKVENLNNTNIINTEKMVFSDKYINENLDLIQSFFNLIVLKKEIDKVIVDINAIFPLVFRIINGISGIKTVSLLEDKTVSYIIFEDLLQSKYIENVDCYAIPSFMFDKLAIEKNMNIKSRCEILFLSNFMDGNDFSTYSDVYYKKNIRIDCKLDKREKEDIESFFRFNNKVRVINLYNVNEDAVEYIFSLLKINNKKNIRIVLEQDKADKTIIDLFDKLCNKNKKLLKNNNLKLKIKYIKEYKEKNTLKQVNLSFFRMILILFIVIAIISIIVFAIKYNGDTDDINGEMDEIDEAIDLNEVDRYIEEDNEIVSENDDREEEETTNNNTNSSSNTSSNKKPVVQSPYYRKFSQVFADLLKINNETVGWLKVNNTNINYPVTRHKDNDYYLNYSFYKKKNSHGWIFMDYRNNIDALDKNTIIYGHRNNKGIMFATLKNVLDKKWYTNKSNQIITFNTLNADMKWQIFSIYTLKNTNDYLITTFTSNDTYNTFLNKIKKRSIYDFGVDVGVDDNILTLSTCYNNAEYRLVVHAKLIK